MVVSLAATAIGVLGSIIGSFLNVVIFRVPARRSIVSPPSACGSCGARIRPWDNVPVLSWLILRGKCRDCSAAISSRYPLVEAGTALFFVVVGLVFGPAVAAADTLAEILSAGLVLVAYLYLASISVALAMIDLDTGRLPNAIVFPAYAVGAVLLVGAALLGADPVRLVTAAIGAVTLGLLYLVTSLSGAMGFGDVKLAGVIGFFLGYLGWEQLIVGGAGAFLLGGLFGVALLVSRRARPKTSVPFGPWMLGGAWLGILAGPSLAAGYLALFGLGAS